MTADSWKTVQAGGSGLEQLIRATFPSQRSFARAAHVDPTNLSRWCRGSRKPPPQAVILMCRALNIDPPSELPINYTQRQSFNALAQAATVAETELAHERDTNQRLLLRIRELESENRSLHRTLAKIRTLVSNT